MSTETQEVTIPKYMERAITSETSNREPYSLLNEKQWREIAQHVYEDEIISRNGTRQVFLPRGTQICFGSGRKKTLDGILNSAVVLHAGVESAVPHYYIAKEIYTSLNELGNLTLHPIVAMFQNK